MDMTMVRIRKANCITQTDLVACIPQMRAFAWVLTNDITRADDLVALALTRALSGARPLPPRTSLKRWMFTILHILHYGEADNELGRDTGQHRGFAATAPAQAVGKTSPELARLARAFSQLRDDQREAIMLDAASGLSREDSAAVCGGPPGMLTIRVVLARQKLMQSLGRVDSPTLRGSDHAHEHAI